MTTKAYSVILALNGLVPERQCSACGKVFRAGGGEPLARMVPLASDEGTFALVVTFACSSACDDREGVVMARTNAAHALAERTKLEAAALDLPALPARAVMV